MTSPITYGVRFGRITFCCLVNDKIPPHQLLPSATPSHTVIYLICINWFYYTITSYSWVKWIFNNYTLDFFQYKSENSCILSNKIWSSILHFNLFNEPCDCLQVRDLCRAYIIYFRWIRYIVNMFLLIISDCLNVAFVSPSMLYGCLFIGLYRFCFRKAK